MRWIAAKKTPDPFAFSGQWIHLALTYDQPSGIATFYVNGVTVGSQSFPAFVPNTTVPWHIGAGWDSVEANYFLNGSVADVRLYDRALSADEIAGLYDLSPAARVSYMANWFDGIDRTIASANYGAVDSFTRPDIPPASSATVLVTSTSYNEAGQPSQTTDPMGYVTQTSYDAAGRTTQTVEAYGSGSDRTTNYAYTLDNLIETLTAVNSTTGDQTTTYVYGTTLSDSGVACNDLLISVAYPDSVSGSDVVSYTYNRQGQQATITDQRGTVRTFFYDELGRLTDDCVTTVGSSTDNAVLRISTTYEVRGMVQTVTSYDNATPGSGTALNQCVLAYNSFVQLVEEQQEHGGTATNSTPSVNYTYSAADPTSPNQTRLLNLIYPNGRVVAYGYGISGQIDDRLNRVYALLSDGAVITQYTYVGGGA